MILPFHRALVVMMNDPERGFLPQNGIHGSIDSIPFDKWMESDGKAMDEEASVVESASEAFELLARGLPNSIKSALLSQYDAPLVPIVERGKDLNCGRVVRASESVLEIRGKIAYCIFCYLLKFLARDEDVEKALHYPGDPELKLTERQRLALGLIREFFILKHFPSLTSFWETYERLSSFSTDTAHHLFPIGAIDRARVEEMLRDDPSAISMYNVVVGIAYESSSLIDLYAAFASYEKMSLACTIGCSIELKRLLAFHDN